MSLINQARALIRPGGKLTHFIRLNQRTALNELLGGEEGEWYAKKLTSLADSIDKMPRTYETESIDFGEKVVHLHYFVGGIDAWIIELDVSAPEDEGHQHQAWGMQRIDPAWGAGTGYISIPELLDAGAELDLHWDTKRVKELGVVR